MENDAYLRYLSGDDSAVEELLRLYSDGLTMYLNNYVRDMNIAEELCDETFIKLVTKMPKFNGKSSFKTFLYSIGRNTALDYLRKHRNKQASSLDELPEIQSDSDPEQSFLRSERDAALHRAILRLKPEYSQVLWLTYFEELSGSEAAAVMKKSVSAVRTLLHRAKPALKKELEKEGFDYENL